MGYILYFMAQTFQSGHQKKNLSYFQTSCFNFFGNEMLRTDCLDWSLETDRAPFAFTLVCLQAWERGGGCHTDYLKANSQTSGDRKIQCQNYVFGFSISFQYRSTSLATEEAVMWLWVEPSLSPMDSRLLTWQTSESACEWLCVHSVHIHWFISGLRPVSIGFHLVWKWLQELSWEQIFVTFCDDTATVSLLQDDHAPVLSAGVISLIYV